MASTPSAAEVRAARSFLRQELKAGTADIPPRRFAAAAKEAGLGYRALAGLLAKYHATQQK